MHRVRRSLLSFLALAAAMLTAGFYVFAARVSAVAPAGEAKIADGIVVLTGGEDRIAAGAMLIEARRGRRLLISGVNRRIGSSEELARHVGGYQRALKCCVDLGHDAKDTIGNAEETRQWARANGYRSLIVVTSSYHMPRSLTEFSIAMPDVTLSAHPVASRHYHLDAWWRHPQTARLLVVEYVKYLASLARYAASRGLGSAQSRPVSGPDRSPNISSI